MAVLQELFLNNADNIYKPGCSNTINRPLRRTLLRSEQRSTVDGQLSTEELTVQVCDARAASCMFFSWAHKKLPEFALPVQIEQTGSDIKNKMKDNTVPQCVIFSAEGCNQNSKWHQPDQ